MSGVTRWWLVRHAPVVNPENRIYGQTDIAADFSDAAALTALARRLPRDAVWLVTPLGRTRGTAEAILGELPPGLIEEPALLEQSFGDWHGATHAELDARGADTMKRFWEAPATACPPGGESFADVVARVGPALERLSEEHAGRDVVAVCHGGSIRAAVAVALGIEPGQALAFQVDPLSLTLLDHILLDPVETRGMRRVWRVVGVNRT